MDTGKKMQAIGRDLVALGWDVYSVTLSPSDGQVGIDKLALRLNHKICERYEQVATISLIGFSMGGLICRYFIQRLHGLNRVEHFITISTPTGVRLQPTCKHE